MKHGTGMPLRQASEMCRALIEMLMPACKPGYCRAAGSVRRMKPRPNDIEIVAVPIFTQVVQLNFLDAGITLSPANKPGENALDVICSVLLSQGVLEKRPDKNGHFAWGSRLKRGTFYWRNQYAPVDLFAVIEPAQWGVIYAIRTGPGDFNRLLVTSKRYGGACPLDRKVAGGRVWDTGGWPNTAAMSAGKFVRMAEETQMPEIATPKESDFFAALGVPLWPPRLRTGEKLRLFLQERVLKAHIAGGQ